LIEIKFSLDVTEGQEVAKNIKSDARWFSSACLEKKIGRRFGNGYLFSW
jgi:hypothetical protein